MFTSLLAYFHSSGESSAIPNLLLRDFIKRLIDCLSQMITMIIMVANRFDLAYL